MLYTGLSMRPKECYWLRYVYTGETYARYLTKLHDRSDAAHGGCAGCMVATPTRDGRDTRRPGYRSQMTRRANNATRCTNPGRARAGGSWRPSKALRVHPARSTCSTILESYTQPRRNYKKTADYVVAARSSLAVNTVMRLRLEARGRDTMFAVVTCYKH